MATTNTAFEMTPRHMLQALRDAHDDVLDAMNTMERVTRGSPNPLEYTRARFAISRASMKRRQLFQRTCAALQPNVDGRDADVLRQLQEADRQLMKDSIAHVGRWTSQAVHDDWAAYGAASRRIRAAMNAELELERNLLFPLLERQAWRFGVSNAGRKSASA